MPPSITCCFPPILSLIMLNFSSFPLVFCRQHGLALSAWRMIEASSQGIYSLCISPRCCVSGFNFFYNGVCLTPSSFLARAVYF
ncbi:hypothetical protein J3F84DRAFT_385431 [Trichoderma pleuroticola]